VAFLKSFQTDKIEQLHGLGRIALPVELQDLHRQKDVVNNGAPFQKNRFLKDHSHLPGGIEIPFRGKRQVAVRLGQEAGDDLQKRRLSAPGGPTRVMNSRR